MFNKEVLIWRSSQRRKDKIMMTTVMVLAVVAIMIAKAVNVNNDLGMSK